MNDCFQKVFAIEDEFSNEGNTNGNMNILNEIQISVEEVEKMLNGFDARKAHGPE